MELNIQYSKRREFSRVGGLVVSMLTSGTQVCGFKPSRSRPIFRGEKSLACLPSEGKYSRWSHVADSGHIKEPYNFRGSQIVG
jgi:hypothetical protein